MSKLLHYLFIVALSAACAFSADDAANERRHAIGEQLQQLETAYQTAKTNLDQWRDSQLANFKTKYESTKAKLAEWQQTTLAQITALRASNRQMLADRSAEISGYIARRDAEMADPRNQGHPDVMVELQGKRSAAVTQLSINEATTGQVLQNADSDLTKVKSDYTAGVMKLNQDFAATNQDLWSDYNTAADRLLTDYHARRDALQNELNLLPVEPAPPAPKPADPTPVAVIAPAPPTPTALPVSVSTPHENFVYVMGSVRQPHRIPWSEGLTLSAAIKAVGGLDDYASSMGRITRDGRKINVRPLRSILNGSSPDIPLQPGDTVFILTSG